MALSLQSLQLDQEKLCCSICLDLLKDPVTLTCGHSYCLSCINNYWDEEAQSDVYSCPQCRETFRPRPVLKKNTMLADLVEELKKTGLQAAPADHCYAGPGDVACDICTGRKLKAVKSCLQCLVSYCEKHLQPHYKSPAFEKHKLTKPSMRVQDNICSLHNEVIKIFCRTDQLCVCYLCAMDEHKGHDTVPAAAERTERQKLFQQSCQNIDQRIQDKEKEVKTLLQEGNNISHSGDKTVTDIEQMIKELIHVIESKASEMKQQIRTQQNIEVNRTTEVVQKLQQELDELKRKCAELEQLSHIEDNTRFLQMFPLLSRLGESTTSLCFTPCPLRYFENSTVAVAEAKDQLESTLREVWPKVSRTVTQVDVLLPHQEPKSRAEFLQFSCCITLDPNTANQHLLLSEGNRKVTYTRKKQPYPSHPERFMSRSQVLSTEALTGRHYWEVEWSGLGVYIAVASKDINRTGVDSEFGDNDMSWALLCSYSDYELCHNKHYTVLKSLRSSRIGVYLDHRAGILSFYRVSDTMALLRRVRMSFTQPLYAGLRAYHFLGSESTAVIGEAE